MRTTILFFFLCAFVPLVSAQYSDPNYSKPQSGYGSDGTHTVSVISFPNRNFPDKDIEIYHPADISTKVPTIFYSHAYGGNISQNIIGLLRFVAMKGYAIVFVPYQTIGVTVSDRYTNLLQGFQKAARDYSSIIDTTRVGFVGHSFGGGASFGNALTCFKNYHWGLNGRFIYALAQWYSFNITQSDLENFPENTKLLTEIFDDDTTNDHRMAIDIFNNISIPASEKDFLLLKSDTVNGHVYAADHVVPNTAAAYDVFDYYAYYRLLDALCDYTFNGSAAGKEVALGNGSATQVNMPAGLKKLIETGHPQPAYPESKYEFPCSDSQNLRRNYCPVITEVNDLYNTTQLMTILPALADKKLTISIPEATTEPNLSIFNSQGQQLLSVRRPAGTSFTVDIPTLSTGIYLAVCGKYRTKFLLR
jgi:hypothetical protein